MPHHNWGDKDFDWDSLYKAERLMIRVFKLFRIGAHTKEKYGAIRASVYFWDGGLHHLIWPGYVYIQNSFINYKLDEYVIKPFTKWTGINWLGVKLQLCGYTLAYYLAMRKYPHIREEICCDADHPEYIIGGMEIHNKYWKRG
jgi:hypothetical protein